MRSAVLVAVSLCALVPLVHGSCFQGLVEKGATHCQDLTDKTWHAVGSTWTNSECIQCSCDTSSMDCCDSMGRVVSSNPEDCAVEYDYTTCTFKEVMKNGYKGPCYYEVNTKSESNCRQRKDYCLIKPVCGS